jgi:Fis family transcriptional regulator
MSQVAELNQAKPAVGKAVRLQDHVQEHLDRYFSELGNTAPNNVYNLVLQQVEKPMLEVVLQQMRYNQSKTAAVLGISRGTLRKKMKAYGLLKADS